MVTKINKSNVDSLRNELEAAIRSMCEKQGLDRLHMHRRNVRKRIANEKSNFGQINHA